MIEITADDIITINKGIIKEWIESHPKNHEGVGSDKDKLEQIIRVADKQESLLAKATYLLGAIAWAQPFAGGNKRTAYTTTKTFLQMNGHTFQVQTKGDIEFLRKLLHEIQEERSELNEETMAKLTLYLANRIRKV